MWLKFKEIYIKIMNFSFRAMRFILRNLNPKTLFYILSLKHRRIIKFAGVANDEKKVLYFPTTYHFVNNIRSLNRFDNYDFLVQQNFLHKEFIDSKKPKVFFTMEPLEYMTEESRKNMEDKKLMPFIYSYDEPNIRRRMFYTALPDNKRPIIKKLERNLYEKRLRFCCIINRYADDKRLNLLEERIKFVKAMGSDIDIYGFDPWCGENRWKEIGNYVGPVNDKIQTLSKYNFAIAFENTDYPGYITEKIFDIMIAGTIPLYWGGESFTKESIPSQCYVDCRNRDANDVYMEIKSYSLEKIVNFRKAAIEFLKSGYSEKFTRRYWAMAVVKRLQEQLKS
jgi:hypothetical protein